MSDIKLCETIYTMHNYHGILNDLYLIEMHEHGIKMIDPFIPKQIREVEGKKVISYGLSSYGYDIRVAPEFKIYSNINTVINDPKSINDDNFVNVQKDEVIIPPNSYVLCRSIERFDLPRDMTALCHGKSTYARAGLVVNVTPLEAGWCGYLTIEIANCSPLPAKIYANEGISQIVFFKGEPCKISYQDRQGKYQNQKAEIVLPRL